MNSHFTDGIRPNLPNLLVINFSLRLRFPILNVSYHQVLGGQLLIQFYEAEEMTEEGDL